MTKNCSAYQEPPVPSARSTSSNFAEIRVGSQVFYDQAAGILTIPTTPATDMLDSNVVLYLWSAGTVSFRSAVSTIGTTAFLPPAANNLQKQTRKE